MALLDQCGARPGWYSVVHLQSPALDVIPCVANSIFCCLCSSGCQPLFLVLHTPGAGFSGSGWFRLNCHSTPVEQFR